ncbi:alpha/beta fold hydrolase [Pseudonocardia sp. NPDC046786]|uniref:thioesterase II family protein n=1 Tax=Pseudonocardia sp. NPDC046786 TaxID=3155471 RepID=UPI00340488C7
MRSTGHDPSAAVRRFTEQPGATCRIVCLAHAGGGANAFRRWPRMFGPQVDVVALQYPGRENRMADPLIDSMPALVEHLSEALVPLTDLPWVLFGHSMGAAVAYELALDLRRRGAPGPHRLVVSAREAPSRARGGDVHLRSDDGIVADLTRLGGTAAEVLAHRELREIVLPVVRNDYRLIETYRPGPAEPLSVPVTALRGDADPDVDAADADAWREITTGAFDAVVLPGGHFYLTEIPDRLGALLGARLPG